MASCVKSLVPSSWRRPRVTELETTTSTCATEAVRRKHVFVIKGYRGLLSRTGGAGESVQSAAFSVGGYDWTVVYYPRGCAHALAGNVSVFVELMTPGATAWASCEVSLVPRHAGGERVHKASTGSCHFRHGDGSAAWRGWCSFMERAKLESPAYLRDDTVRIMCTVTVFKQRSAAANNSVPWTGAAPPPAVGDVQVAVPPSELTSDLAKLLLGDSNNNNGAPPPPPDVTLVVGSESFGAHSSVLWARCPRLYGRVTSWKILVLAESEVRPAVFRALLHYIYTDSLLAMDGPTNTKTETLRGLLAAADQYGIQRLKLMCERSLCASLDAGTVAATLALAERLQCPALRRACTQFIRSHC